jgi:hypothetical protein
MADAGGISVAVGSGANTGVGLAIGGSVAVNVVSNDTRAYISGSVIGAPGALVGDVTLNAEADSRIWALTIAGSVSVGHSKNKFGGALSGSIAGSVNIVTNTIETGITGGTSVKSSAGLSLSATDKTGIIANAAGGSLSVGAGKTGLAMAVGGSFAINSIGNTVRSYVDSSTLDTNGAISIISTSDSSIWGLAVGAAVGVGVGSAGGTGASLSIGVSVSHNSIGNITESYIKNSSSVLTGGNDITISAVDNASIMAFAMAASISVGVSKGGSGVALSGGGAGAENVIYSTTNAYIDNSNLGTVANVGKVDLDAISTSEILAIVPTVSASVSYGSKAGVGAAIGVSVARNIIGSRTGNVVSDYTTNDTPGFINTGDTIRIADGPREGEVYEYTGEIYDRYDINADAGMVDVDREDRVWVEDKNSGIAPSGIYRYIGEEADVSGLSVEFVFGSDDDPDSITRSTGNWAEDGFSAGQQIEISGTASNDGIYTIASITDRDFSEVDGVSEIYLVESLSAAGTDSATIETTGNIDLTSADYLDTNNWEHHDMLNLTGLSFGDASSWKRVLKCRPI